MQPVPFVIFNGTVAWKQRHLLDSIQVGLEKNFRIVDAPKLMLSKVGKAAGTVCAMALLNR